MLPSPRPGSVYAWRLVVVALFALTGRTARGADLSVRAPPQCVEASAIAEQASDLLGRPLASIPDVDFEIEIASLPKHGWHLQLDLIDRRDPGSGEPGIRRTRELSAQSCTELADAAAVAIAMSVRSMEDARGSEASTSRSTAPPQEVRQHLAASPPPGPTTSVAATAPIPTSESVRPAIAVALVVDAGALPHAGLGLELGGSVQRRRLRLIALATLFASQQAQLPDGAPGQGGDFRLVLGAALACFAPGLGRSTLLGCAGFELGRLSGQGQEVARPVLGTATWAAARAEVGLAVGLGSKLALVLRAGVTVPPSRPPEFVLDGNMPVFRPSRVTGRGTFGLELGF
jgi:hypothetical protein